MTRSEKTVALGTVTPEECQRIQDIFQRKLALQSLLRTLAETAGPVPEDLYERLVADSGEVEQQMHRWWSEIHQKYGWDNPETARWAIDFTTRAVTLHFPEEAD